MGNHYKVCACGKKMRAISKRCRACWLRDKEALIAHGRTKGYKPGNTPWHKGTTGLIRWTPERHEKMAAFFARGAGMKGKKHKIETRQYMSKLMMGENSPNWKGGITKLNKKGARNTLERRLWLEACLRRDDYTCQVCFTRGSRLEVHHIKTWSAYPELRTVESNGITLCKPCHTLTLKREKLCEKFFLEIASHDKTTRLETFHQMFSKKGMNSGNL